MLKTRVGPISTCSHAECIFSCCKPQQTLVAIPEEHKYPIGMYTCIEKYGHCDGPRSKEHTIAIPDDGKKDWIKDVSILFLFAGSLCTDDHRSPTGRTLRPSSLMWHVMPSLDAVPVPGMSARFMHS